MQIDSKLPVSLNSVSPSSLQSHSIWSAVSRRRTQKRHRLAVFGFKLARWCQNGPCAVMNHIGSFLRNSFTSILYGTVYSPSVSSFRFASSTADFSSRSLPWNSSWQAISSLTSRPGCSVTPPYKNTIVAAISRERFWFKNTEQSTNSLPMKA